MENTQEIPLLSILPFVLMLGAIAVLPLTWNHFWEKNKNKLLISIILSIPVLIFLLINGYTHEIIHTMLFDYVPFIILLGALFTITGGILLTGDIQAKPAINTLFLGIGAVLASFMGTTGAAMLLIRPVIQTNKERTFKVHTILFFIAIVANCGGLLTPLGDPPLFMMYLRGAPFEWFFKLGIEWFFTNAILLILYFLVDSYYYKKEPTAAIKRDESVIRPIKIQGKRNFIFLAGVVLSVAFLNEQYLSFVSINPYYKFVREEVAYLFFGIFVTMVPALLYLETNAKHLGVQTISQFYYYTGLLSSFLDNTPTAVTFHSLAMGLGITTGKLVAGIPEELLKAISTSAVFFGAMTYIGNGPNFMVKAVAEENNIKMPDFFSYMIKFSIIVLLPIFILIQLLFIH